MNTNLPVAHAASMRRASRTAHSAPEPAKPEFVENLGLGLRLRKMREKRGLSFAEIASETQISRVTYYQHEVSRRFPCNRTIDVYASFYGISTDWLLHGHGPMIKLSGPQHVPVAGVVGKGGRVRDVMDTHVTVPKWLRLDPAGDMDVQAMLVETDDLHPRYRLGDVIFFSAIDGLQLEPIEGRECIVTLRNGVRLLRICHADPEGGWALSSYNSAHVERCMQIVAASPILGVQCAALPLPFAKPPS